MRVSLFVKRNLLNIMRFEMKKLKITLMKDAKQQAK